MPTVLGHGFGILQCTHLHGGLQPGGLQSRATDFGYCNAFICIEAMYRTPQARLGACLVNLVYTVMVSKTATQPTFANHTAIHACSVAQRMRRTAIYAYALYDQLCASISWRRLVRFCKEEPCLMAGCHYGCVLSVMARNFL